MDTLQPADKGLRVNGVSIALDAVTRRFGQVVAVDNACISLEPGVLHAIVGENGAGKSTLLKLAAGVLVPDTGTVRIDDALLTPATAAEAIRRGVGMVHQHFMLIGTFRAIENIVLANEPVGSFGRLDLDVARAQVQGLMQRAGLVIPLDQITDGLTIGQRQKLEILRVLYRGARAVLLDEPTAVLSPIEADELYATLRHLVDQGRTVAVVTHRLDEVTRFADHVTVMRRGRVVLTKVGEKGSSAEQELTRAIMGGEPPPLVEPPALPDSAPVVLDIAGLTVIDTAGRRLLDSVDLAIRAGEIVGIAGVEGNGQRELVRALAGLLPSASGRVSVTNQVVASSSTVRQRRACLGVVHEDRHTEGLLLDASIGDNLVLGDLGDPHPSGFDEHALIAKRIDRFGIHPADPSRLALELSGGNQQKVVVARALDRIMHAEKHHAAAVLAQPTRGVDVGAASTIHASISKAAEQGLAVLIVSADLAELRRLCHRLVVLRKGKVVTTLPPTCSDEEIGKAMLGLEAA